MQTCTLEFLYRNLILMTWNGSGKALFEQEMENQVLLVHFPALLCAGWQCGSPISLVPQYLPKTGKKLELFDWIIMVNFSMYSKIRDPPGESKTFSPILSMSVSSGILWSSLELEQGRWLLQKCILSPNSPSRHVNCNGMGWIITVFLPALLLKTVWGLVCWIFLFFSFPISCVLYCLTKVWVTSAPWISWGWQVTHCSMAVGNSVTAPWLSVAFGSWLYHSYPWTLLNLSREPTTTSCVFNILAVSVSQRLFLPVSVSTFQAQTILQMWQLLLWSNSGPLPGWCLWCRCQWDSATLLALCF